MPERFFKKVDFEKNQQMTKSIAKYPIMQRVEALLLLTRLFLKPQTLKITAGALVGNTTDLHWIFLK